MPLDHSNPWRFLLCARYRLLSQEGEHFTAKAFELVRPGTGPDGTAADAPPAFGDDARLLAFRRLPFGEFAD